MQVSICSLHVLSGFGRRTASEVSMDFVFCRGVLSTIFLVESTTAVGVSRSRVRCELGIFPGSMIVIPYQVDGA